MDYFASVKAFLSAAEFSSFSKAAVRMSLKTSTISRYINELEADLGIALFNRSTRGLVLTEGGRVFRDHVCVAMDALENARQATSTLNASPQGVLKVSMPSSFGRKVVMAHLPEFLALHPRIDVEAVVTDDVPNMIEAGIDLSIRIGDLPDSQMMARQLASERRIVCASPAYVANHGSPQSPESLLQHNVIRIGSGPASRWNLFNLASAAAKGEPVAVAGRVVTNDSAAASLLAIAGCGIALLPTWEVAPDLEQGRLVRLLPGLEGQASPAGVGIWAVYPPKKIVSSKVRAFVDFYVHRLEKVEAPAESRPS